MSSGRLRLTAPYCIHNRVLSLEVALDRLDEPLGDFADMCGKKIPLASIQGRAEGQAGTEPGAMTPIGASRILTQLNFLFAITSAKSSAFVFISNHIIPKEKVKVV